MRPRHLFAPLLLAGLIATASLNAEDSPYHREILQRLQRWEAADPALTRSAAPPARNGQGKGYALCIGLNRVDPNSYAGWDGVLTGCENDVADLTKIAEDRGFAIKTLLNEQATLEAFRSELSRLAATAKRDETVLIGFAGHGGLVPNYNHGDKFEDQNATWCLFNGQLIDDELMFAWTKFAPGVRVLVITDSCHGGGMFKRRADELRQLSRASKHPRLADKQMQDRFAQLDSDAAPRNGQPSAVRAMPPSVSKRIIADPKLGSKYEQYSRGLPQPQKSESAIEAAVIFIASCQVDQLSIDGDSNGLFTTTLKAAYARGEIKGRTYRELRHIVAKDMPLFQQPSLFATGKHTAEFLNHVPFDR